MFPINKIYLASVNKISTHLPECCDADTYPLTLELWCRYLARLWSRYHPSYLVFRIQILSAHLPLDCDLGHWTWPPPSPASAPDRRRWGWCHASVTSQFPGTDPSQPADSHPCWPASLGTPQQGSTNKTQWSINLSGDLELSLHVEWLFGVIRIVIENSILKVLM